ncbi:hypothetical protein QQG55_41670 [Brugia pahangi]
MGGNVEYMHYCGALVFRISDKPSRTMCLVREEEEHTQRERKTALVVYVGNSLELGLVREQQAARMPHPPTLNTPPDPTIITPPHEQRVKEVGGVSTDRKATCVSLLG